MLSGFKDFLMRGNLIEVAVGLVMALAVFEVVQALIADLITPLIGAIVGEPSFGGLTFALNDSEFLYGDFINALITFVSIAGAVYFFIVLPFQKIQERRGVTSETQTCAQCLSEIPAGATRCAFCTSEVRPPAPA